MKAFTASGSNSQSIFRIKAFQLFQTIESTNGVLTMQATEDQTALFSRAEAPVFTVSNEIVELTRKNLSGLLHRLRMVKGVKVAERLNTSEATVSRMADWELHRMSQILAALGMKAVSMEMHCLPADQMQALVKMADELKNARTLAQLTFDDPE
jgi:hypothetical protein